MSYDAGIVDQINPDIRAAGLCMNSKYSVTAKKNSIDGNNSTTFS